MASQLPKTPLTTGEEPAGPMAICQNLQVLLTLSKQRIPVVCFPVCNPGGYYRDDRYPNAHRNWKIGKSVTEADHLMPHPDEPWRARVDEPATPETWAINNHIIELNSEYPPLLWIDLHEDESLESSTIPAYLRYASYCYSGGLLGCDDPIARQISRMFASSGLAMQMVGETRFGEAIENGLVNPQTGEGSIDELAARDSYILGGVVRPKYPARSAVVTETPTIRMAERNGDKYPEPVPLRERIAAQGLVLQALPLFFQRAVREFL